MTLTPNMDIAHGKPIRDMGKCGLLSTTRINPRISNGNAVPQITTKSSQNPAGIWDEGG